ncbi:MAG: hypothetical protein JO194_07125 [Candidatus Eremiobacteraeota bacterium]|nr:hypothetical protein [Candidatus Eremiobacteraeota bacterium]
MIPVQLFRGALLAVGIALAAVLPASGAAEIGSQTGVVVDLNKGVWVHGPDLPSARQDAAVAVMDGRIYLVGGFGPHDEQMATLLVLEPTFPSPQANPGVAGPIVSHPGEWRLASTIPESVDHAAAAGLGGYLYVAGGRIEDLVTNKFWRYDPIDDSWMELPSLPFPRYGPMMQAVNGKLYLLGGQSSHGNDETSMFIFDPATNTWRTEEYVLGDSRFLAASVVINEKIYVVGGRDRNQNSLRTCDVYDPARDRWGACSSMHVGRSDFGLAAVNGRLMAIGGENYAGSAQDQESAITFEGDLRRTVTQTTEISSSSIGGWISGPWMPYPRHGMAVASLGNQIWVIGGAPYSGTAPVTSVLRFVSPVTQIKFQKGRVQP